MQRSSDGWWSLESSGATAGSDYGFVVDGEGPFPDPRSPWQPNGVHGLSRVVDHGAFAWTDRQFRARPLGKAVIYELHIGTFTLAGTFNAAIEKLDHLVQLGVTHAELMPVNAFGGNRGWGYDGVDLFAPHQAYGGPDGLKRFVNACHEHGLEVILDVVFNHVGPSGNYLGRFAPYFYSRYQTPWGPAFNFDGVHSEEVRRFCCDSALMWLRDYHFDGLRLDAIQTILDASAVPFLEQLAQEVRDLEAKQARRLFILSESDQNDPRPLWQPERGGWGFTAQWCDDFHHALHAVLTGERNGLYADFGSLADLAKALGNAYVYDGQIAPSRQRRLGRPRGGLSGNQFVGFAQNHDQIGNRARGERLSQLVSPGRQKIAAALLFSSPLVPMLFQGEEWGARTPFLYFTDHEEPALAEAVRAGRRIEFAAFGWKAEDLADPQACETLERSKLDWSELSRAPHADLLEWHRLLIDLRRAEPALTDGRLDRAQPRFDEAARWFVLDRAPLVVACNLADRPQRVLLPTARRHVLAASDRGFTLDDDSVQLPPDSVVVLKSAD
jgi:maltooligosyltrehalose trehalohydrolase